MRSRFEVFGDYSMEVSQIKESSSLRAPYIISSHALSMKKNDFSIWDEFLDATLLKIGLTALAWNQSHPMIFKIAHS